jgi:hypothetical protein
LILEIKGQKVCFARTFSMLSVCSFKRYYLSVPVVCFRYARFLNTDDAAIDFGLQL